MKLARILLLKLRTRIIHLGLLMVSILLVLYLAYSPFRVALEAQKIDPNFVIGFFTITALLLSLIQGSKDKRYSYNLRLIDSIEDKGLKVVGKLIGIKAKSLVMLSSAKHCVEAKKQKRIFTDLNDTLSKEGVEAEMESATAYINLYFPEQGGNWNVLIDKLTEISNITGNILVNYQKNLEIINHPDFRNSVLDNTEFSLRRAEELHNDIEELTLEIRDGIVSKMNKSKESLKNSFDF